MRVLPKDLCLANPNYFNWTKRIFTVCDYLFHLVVNNYYE